MSEQEFKVIVVGDRDVGKSCLIHTFMSNVYPSESSKIHWTSVPEPKTVTVNSSSSKLTIYEDENTVNTGLPFLAKYNTNCNAALVLYDVTNRESFDNASKWIDDAVEKCYREAVFMIVATKVDKDDRRVSTSEGKTFAEKNKCLYIEVSAKSYKNVQECFHELTKALQRRYGCTIQ